MMIYQAVAKVIDAGERAALCTVVQTSGSTPRHAGSKMLVYPTGQFLGTVGGGEIEQRVMHEALEAINDGKIRMLEYQMVNPEDGDPGVCGGSLKVYIEPIKPSAQIIVVGGGHVGKAVVHLAHWLGFRVAISDDREELCNPEIHPNADAYYPVTLAELPKFAAINSETYIILTTRGSSVDVDGLEPVLKTSAGYIGVIGSKRRWLTTRKALVERGVPETLINKVHSPIGLELNAETPEEIAVSILAEIIMLRNHGTGNLMKL